MTGPWTGAPGGPGEHGEPGAPRDPQPPAPGSEPGDRLPGAYGGPPRDGGIPDGEPGHPDGLPDGEPGVPHHRETPREQHDRTGGEPGPWKAPTPAESGGSGNDGPAGEPPEDVRTAWVLWLAATAFAVVGMWINALTSSIADLPQSTRDALEQAAAGGGETLSTGAVFTGAMIVGAVLAVLVAAVTIWLAFRMRAGKPWARTLLDIAGVFLGVDAVAVVIGVFTGTAVAGSRGEALTFLVMSLQILAGLCAAVAVWRQHTAEAGEYVGGGARERR